MLTTAELFRLLWGGLAGGSRASGRDNGSARADGSTWGEDAGTSGRADGAHGTSVPGGYSASHGLSAADATLAPVQPVPLCGMGPGSHDPGYRRDLADPEAFRTA